jgi:hypothetical protein
VARLYRERRDGSGGAKVGGVFVRSLGFALGAGFQKIVAGLKATTSDQPESAAEVLARMKAWAAA